MEFCLLPPFDNLELAKLSTSHLCLTHIKSERYWEFYLERLRAGDFVFLDNGAYEGSSDWNRLRNMIAFLQPNVTILPDYINQPWERTFTHAFDFLQEHHKLFPFTEWMFVPQALKGDIVGWSRALHYALEDDRVTWVGLPRCLPTLYTNDFYVRSRIAEHLKRERPDISIHALGMVNGDINEFNALKLSGCVESIDSHWPLKSQVEMHKRLELIGVNTNSLARA